MYQIEQLNSPLDIHTENLKKKKIGKITYIKMERFLKFKTVTGYSLGIYWKVKVLVAQLFLTLCDPMDCSPAGSSVHRILQARILEWVAIPFSRDVPNPEIQPGSPALQADSLPDSLPSEPPRKSQDILD